MPSDLPRVYFDACIFLDYISDHPERAPIIEDIVELSLRNETDILTSTVSIVEVSYVLDEKEAQKLDPHIEAKIDGMFNDEAVVKLVDFSPLIARNARSLTT